MMTRFRPRPRPRIALAACLVLLGLTGGAAPVAAQIMGEPSDPYPDPDKFARGLYAEAEAGTVIFVGDAGKPLGPGTALGLRLGYDIFRWAALQVHAVGSSHGTDFAGQPQDGQLLQVLQGSAELKLTLPLGAWSGHLYGGVGRARLSSNLLATAGVTDAGVRQSTLAGGGLGVDYHTRSRHFSFGLSAGLQRWLRLAGTSSINVAVAMRYTF